MASNDNEQYLLNQQVSFIQHFLPGLDAGEYKLDLTQAIKGVDGASYQSEYQFAVQADRFSFANPGNILSSVFPADNSTGEFSNVLPHVVFSQKTFPWVRYPTDTAPYDPPAPGTDTDADVPTWLWVMLLDDDDVAAFPTLDLSPATQKLVDLLPPTVPLPSGKTSSLGSNYSYFNGAKSLDGLEPGQTLDDKVQTIDVPLRLFWQLAPTIADLKQMAHGRVVSIVDQTTVTSQSGPGEPIGSFSVVFGNRLPADQKKTYAFLVSLEGLEDFLPDSKNDGSPKNNTFDGDLSLRLAVLTSWTFTSDGQPATFVHQLLKLNGRVIDDPKIPQPPPASNTNLRLPYSGANPVLKGAFNMGYVPLNETMRTAEKNVSWYRGPLAPSLTSQTWLKVPITSPDAAMIFDPTTGLLDVSYASAWTIGRMIALQDTGFSTALYNWKQSLEQQVVRSVERNLFEQTMGHALTQLPSADDGAQTVHGRESESLLKRTLLALDPNA